VEKIDFINETSFELNLERFEQILDQLTTKRIELVLTNSSSMQKLNNQYRNINKPTDVLSFPLEDMLYAPLGSIIVNIDFAKAKALELNHNIEEEITLLFIHGLLHLLGFDHETDEGQMRSEEEKLIEKFDLPSSLIVRNDG
jgi:probable rRNA maturation factor